ncbi:MAG: CBS domain-containing protein [Polyangia bacterium]
MQVKQVMSHPVVTCHVEDPINRAAQLMWEHDCGAVPVVDDLGRAVAMLTDRDVCMAAYTQGRLLCDIKVRSAMSRTVIACSEDDPLTKAEQLMQQHQIRRLPVLDALGRPIGMLSLNDLARVATKQHPAAHGLANGISSTSTAQTLATVCAPRSSELEAPLI